MTTSDRDPLPRLADALTDVGLRLRDIGEELRTLQAHPAAPPAASTQPFAAPASWSASHDPSVRPDLQQPALGVPQPGQPHPTPPWTYAGPREQVAAPQYPPSPAPMSWPQPPQFPPYGGHGPAPRHAGAPLPPLASPYLPAPHTPRPSIWDRVSREGAGSRVLAWLGGGVTLAGVLLLLVLAVQRGYIGPLPRVLAGAALAAALVGIGLALHRSAANRIGALAVVATGFAGLYLDVVAATSFYDYLPTPAGLLVGLLVAGVGLGIAARWNSQLVGTFVVIGCAVSAPALTHGFVPLLVGFLLVLQIATTPVQLVRRWSVLATAAAVPPVLAVLAVVGTAHHHGPDVATVLALCAATGVVQLAFAVLTAARGDLPLATGLVLSGPVPTLIGVQLATRPAGALLVAGLAVLLAAVWALHRRPVTKRFVDAAGAAAAVAAFESLALALHGTALAAALLGGGILLAVLAERLRYAAALVPAMFFTAVGALGALDRPLLPRTLSHAPTGRLDRADVATTGTTGLLLAVAAVALAWSASRVRHARTDEGGRTRWLVAGGIGLYGASAAVLSIGLAVSPDTRGFLTGHVLVTLSWTVGALVLLLRHIDSTPLRVAGLALVAAALAKLVLFDLSSLSGIPRVLAFLGAGLVLLAAGARYAALVAGRDRTDDAPPQPSS